MPTQTSSTHGAAAHTRADERLYEQLAGLAALAAFPAAQLPGDLAASIGAAAKAAQDRIGELLPQYCGFGLGYLVDVAGTPTGIGPARVENVLINEGGAASILLRAVGDDGAELDQRLQFPLFYARRAMTPSQWASADPEEPAPAPAP